MKNQIEKIEAEIAEMEKEEGITLEETVRNYQAGRDWNDELFQMGELLWSLNNPQG